MKSLLLPSFKGIQFKKNLLPLIDIIYPNFCFLCKNKIEDSNFEGICKQCLTGIKINNAPVCKKCGAAFKSATSAMQCHFCKGQNYCFDQALSVAAYDLTLRSCIHLFKYKRKLKLGLLLAEKMKDFLERSLDTKLIDLIIPVPLHTTKSKERGFNQADVLANYLQQELKIQCLNLNLRRVRKTRSQFDLNLPQRRKNVAGAFKCTAPEACKGKSILLVDDIFTTGSTLNECAFVLKQAGALKVTALTMAR